MREIKFRQFINGHWHYWGFIDGVFVSPAKSKTEIYPSMQFTEYKDKDGKEIYEDDILRDDMRNKSVATFGELPLDKSGDCVCSYKSFYARCYGKLGVAPFYECEELGVGKEIIGNIHENPELLEE